MTTEQIYSIPVDGKGWRVLPSGNYVKLGDEVKLGNYVTLGSYVTLGDYVTLGNGVTLAASPLAVQGTKHLAVNTGAGLIQIGCHTRTFAQWIADYEQVGTDEGYSKDQIAEYKRIIDFIVANGSQPTASPTPL